MEGAALVGFGGGVLLNNVGQCALEVGHVLQGGEEPDGLETAVGVALNVAELNEGDNLGGE